MAQVVLVTAFALISTVVAQQCSIQFDGRVPKAAALTDFDSSTSLFSSTFDLGAGLKWSNVLTFPSVNTSLFDANATKAVEVTINDKSIFNNQTGFRRAELLPASNSGTDPSTIGVKTVHFSIMKDTAKPLNTSHEYQLFFLESSDFSTNQVVLKTGTILGGNPTGVSADSLMLFGNVNSNPIPLLFSTSFTPGVLHNFGITLNFNANTTQVFYSTNSSPLKSVSSAVSNNVAGQGEFHFGLLKKPTDPGADVTKSGFQESGINEGIIFGGIFEEDSSSGCISLQP